MTDPSPANLAANTTTGNGQDGPLDIKKRARRRLVGAIALVLLAVIVLPMVMDQEPKPITQDIQIHIPSQEPGTGSFISRIKPGAPAPTPLPAEPPASQSITTAPTVAATTNDAETKPAPAPAATTATPAHPATKPETKTEPAKPAAATPVPPAPAAATSAAEKPAEPKTPAKPAEKPPAAQSAESARAAALLNDERWVVQLGAYQDQANVKLLQGKIKELGYPIFTEKVDTPQGARIRVRCGPFPSREAAEKAQVRLKKISAGGPTGGVVAQMQ